MMVQQHQVDVVANNLANVNTASFKRDVATFRTRLPESQTDASGFAYRNPVLDCLGGGIELGSSTTQFDQGEMEVTNRPLDVCIRGPGLFAVRDLDGQTVYTRDGRFTVNEQNQLAMLDGRRLVLDDSKQPITVDPAQPLTFSNDGTISQQGQPVAKLSLTDFTSQPGALRKLGANLYAAASAGQTIPALLTAGCIEKSTVDPVKELVTMIEAQRAYEANAQMIRLQDETLSRAVNDVPRNV
jgi:flagellar basal body rod protein FlgG